MKPQREHGGSSLTCFVELSGETLTQSHVCGVAGFRTFQVDRCDNLIITCLELISFKLKVVRSNISVA